MLLDEAADALVLSDPDTATSEPAHAMNAAINDPARLAKILLTFNPLGRYVMHYSFIKLAGGDGRHQPF